MILFLQAMSILFLKRLILLRHSLAQEVHNEHNKEITTGESTAAIKPKKTNTNKETKGNTPRIQTKTNTNTIPT
jgi:hypothetical protein